MKLRFLICGAVSSLALRAAMLLPAADAWPVTPLPPHRVQEDVVVLRNGQTISGAVANDTLVVVTSGGEVRLPKGAVVRIDFGSPPSAVERTNVPPSGNAPPTDLSHLGLAPDALLWVPPGQFVMGSPYDEIGRDRDESPQTTVIFPAGFWMGKCEVTQKEYEQVTGNNPSTNTETGDRPVEKISWLEAMEFCAQLNRLARTAGGLPPEMGFRLPTEAEWEYACRAGTDTRFNFGDDKGDLELRDYAWYARNSDSSTHPVGQKKPNAWGLFDMHGNVWEWCLDRWEGGLPGGTVTNRPAAGQGILRAARGGSWLYEARACRAANRDDYGPANRCADLGFRIVLAPLPVTEPPNR